MTHEEAQAPRRPGTPSEWVTRFAPNAAKSSENALDLACGSGRHTRYLLDRGYAVTAIDRDISGLDDIAERPNLEIIATDLEAPMGDWCLGVRQFDLVVVTNYLWRPLLPLIVGAVTPGGRLIYETFGLGNERFGRPRNPDFLLQPGELKAMVAGQLKVLAYEHGEMKLPRPAIVQRICAQRGT
jgi:SAM-dependent methyltransferase